MAEAEPSHAPSPRPAAYRFAGVVLDLHRGCLRVDGTEVAAAPLLLQLLQCLCESEGRLLPRQLLFDTLWPGGQVVSDAALSQLIWRLRAALGPYAECIATVRGSGVRLDAPVAVEFAVPRSVWPVAPDTPPAPAMTAADVAAAAAATADAPPAATTAGSAAGTLQDSAVAAVSAAPSSGAVTDAALPVTGHVAASWLSRRRAIAALLLAAAALGLAAGWWWSHSNPLISDGYALHAADLQASRADIVPIAATAFRRRSR